MDAEIHFPNMNNTLQLTGCILGEKPPGWTYPMHHHHVFELLYCRSGEVYQRIRQRLICLQAGEWLLLRPGVRHDFHNRSAENYSFFNVHFDMDDQEVRHLLGTDSYLHISQEMAAGSMLPQCMGEIERMMQEGMPSDQQVGSIQKVQLAYENKLAIQAYILLIINQLIMLRTNLQPQTFVDQHQQDVSVYETDVAHAIEELLAEQWKLPDGSVAGIAKQLGLSRSQCTKVFTKIYGISPRQYISKLKLKEAKRLLVVTNETIESIALLLGFGSASHFSRQFRRWTGISPNRFRPKHTVALKSELDSEELDTD